MLKVKILFDGCNGSNQFGKLSFINDEYQLSATKVSLVDEGCKDCCCLLPVPHTRLHSPYFSSAVNASMISVHGISSTISLVITVVILAFSLKQKLPCLSGL